MANTENRMTVMDAAQIIKTGNTKENYQALYSLSKSFPGLVNVLTPLVNNEGFMEFLEYLPEKVGPRSIENRIREAVEYVNPKRFTEDEDGNLVPKNKKDKKSKKKSKKEAEPEEDEELDEEEDEEEEDEDEEKEAPAKKSKKSKKDKKAKKSKKSKKDEDDEDDDFDDDFDL